jgi:hypothetical protein
MRVRQLEVQIDSPEEVQAVEKAFRRAGPEANVRACVIELSEQFTWIVIISASASMLLTGCFAAADAWNATERLSGRLRQTVLIDQLVEY